MMITDMALKSLLKMQHTFDELIMEARTHFGAKSHREELQEPMSCGRGIRR